MVDFKKMQAFVLRKLEDGLSENLFYHSVEHTLDVWEAATRIGNAERISDENMVLLQTAAILHDTGFLVQYFKNEPVACELALEWLPQFRYNSHEIAAINEMILATAIPQTPRTRLAQILCDADLDYLGRSDFYEIGNRLFEEFKLHKVVDGEQSWNRLQVSFLESHDYFTDCSKENRHLVKMGHLSELKNLVNSYI